MFLQSWAPKEPKGGEREMMRKTKLMRSVEIRYNNRPLEKLLPEMYNELGLPGMAEKLQISKGTLWYWLLKFGISVRRVALAPGESLEVKGEVVTRKNAA